MYSTRNIISYKYHIKNETKDSQVRNNYMNTLKNGKKHPLQWKSIDIHNDIIISR